MTGRTTVGIHVSVTRVAQVCVAHLSIALLRLPQRILVARDTMGSRECYDEVYMYTSSTLHVIMPSVVLMVTRTRWKHLLWRVMLPQLVRGNHEFHTKA